MAKIENAAPSTASIKGKPDRRLLVFTLANGYILKATPWGVEALRILGETTGTFTTVHSNDPAVFEKQSLARFDAVCFLNTCYTPFDDAEHPIILRHYLAGIQFAFGDLAADATPSAQVAD